MLSRTEGSTMKKADVNKLKDMIGRDNVRDDPADLYIYGSDASVHEARASAVVRPRTSKEVQQIMRYANAERIPVIPRGAGSGMSGHTVPIDGGIVMDFKLMDRIIEIRPEDTLCKVEPGVVDDDLNRALKPYNVFWPAAPASSKIATIGGEIANNASGIRSVKYGATRDSVLGMKVILANGDLVALGSNTRVEASGYQLDRLMVGSEGTLGIIVEATLKVVPLPKFRCLGMASFNKLEEAGDSISEIISSGASPSMLELMDNVAITAVNTTLNIGLPDVEAIVLFEADGMVKGAVDYEIEKMKKVCEGHNGFGIEMSYDAKMRTKIYSGRKKLFAALSRYKEGLSCTSLADDMAVPYSKMAECAKKIHEIAERNNVTMTAYGHCGSGCMHTKILMDPTKKSQWEDAKRAVVEVYDYVRSVGGTTSAEHGIALSKAPSWKQEKADSLALMRAVKKAFDPNKILNPHKLQDAPEDWVTATKLRYWARR
jgi:glycolate oxidase